MTQIILWVLLLAAYFYMFRIVEQSSNQSRKQPRKHNGK